MELIPKHMSSRHRLILLLVAAVIFLAKNLTDFLIVASLIERYMLTACTSDIVTVSLFNSNYSSISFSLDACTMATRE